MRRIRGRYAAAALGALVAISVGTTTFVVAQDGGAEESGGASSAGPGEPYVGEESDLAESSGATEAIVTGGGTYDETVLTKFIPASALIATQGDAAEADLVRSESGDNACMRPVNVGGGTLAQLRAPVELPDGARINRVIAYGQDTYAPADIVFRLIRTTVTTSVIALTPPTRSETVVDEWTTSGVNGNFASNNGNDLDETAGSFSTGLVTGVAHRFHTVYVRMTNAATASHVICGIEVTYQVPAASTPTGTVFTPIDPIRAYDSRQAAYAPNNVVLGPNQSRVISIKDARDTAGNIVTADVIPTNATAITYNITIAGPTAPNFVAVTPGDAASFTASAINFNGTADIANAGTVKIAADRTIKVWGGDQSGSMHILIDVTGYYTPVQNPSFPNMGN
jgi:hypothetical protein